MQFLNAIPSLTGSKCLMFSGKENLDGKPALPALDWEAGHPGSKKNGLLEWSNLQWKAIPLSF